jgi:hypothetical protein
VPRRTDGDAGDDRAQGEGARDDERWAALGEDLAARAAARETAGRAEDAAELTRAELSRITLVDRLRAHVDVVLTLDVLGAGPLRGRVRSVGPDVVVMAAEPPAREVLVPLHALLGVVGAGSRARPPQATSRVDLALGLAHGLRRCARDRARVRLVLRDGSVRTGTVDAVAEDHVELAEHPLDVARRRTAVTAHRLVPLAALASVTVQNP